jgi:hypothetical protein
LKSLQDAILATPQGITRLMDMMQDREVWFIVVFHIFHLFIFPRPLFSLWLLLLGYPE